MTNLMKEPLELRHPIEEQLKIMALAFWRTSVRVRVLLSASVVLILILTTTYFQYRINLWAAPFYDALERKDVDGLLEQLRSFAILASSLTVLNVAQAWYNQATALAMREGLSGLLIDEWLKPGRANRLDMLGPLGENPDQRLHEDARGLAENTTLLAIGLVNSSVLLASFIGVLWSLSQPFHTDLFGIEFSIVGYLVWTALIYAGLASALGALVGRSLTTLNARRYALEAELRYSLVNASEHVALIGISRGEENERRRLRQSLSNVLLTWRKVMVASTNLTWISAGFGWAFQVVPIIVASPMYFRNQISFGELMMAVGAFVQVNAALRWYVDNIRTIADWKATLLRVSTFLHGLSQLDRPGLDEAERKQDGGELLVLKDLELRPLSAVGGAGLRLPGQVTVERGQKIMIAADDGVDLRLFFLAIASDLKPSGGSIRLPARGSMSYMPQLGYFPAATLAELLTYPQEPVLFDRQRLVAALRDAGAPHLASQLTTRKKWAQELNREDAVRVRVANTLLAKPDWLIVDDVLEGLEPPAQAALCAVFASLPCSIVYVGNSDAFSRIVGPRIVMANKIEG